MWDHPSPASSVCLLLQQEEEHLVGTACILDRVFLRKKIPFFYFFSLPLVILFICNLPQHSDIFYLFTPFFPHLLLSFSAPYFWGIEPSSKHTRTKRKKHDNHFLLLGEREQIDQVEGSSVKPSRVSMTSWLAQAFCNNPTRGSLQKYRK